MKKINKHIEIVRTTKPGLSSMGQESADLLEPVLRRHFRTVGVTIINDLSDLDRLAIINPDLVFLTVKFLPVHPELGANDPQKVWVSSFLDENEIEHIGSTKKSHELELNKELAKRVVKDAGLQTSEFFLVPQGESPRLDHSLNYPLFVKPSNRGGGVGINAKSVVNNHEELVSKVKAISLDHEADSLVEQYLSGREFSVAILRQSERDDYSVMPLELVAPSVDDGPRLLSEDVKSANAEATKPVTDLALKLLISNLAIEVFHALGARDYGRIDIRLSEDGAANFLEANLIPSLIEGYGSFPKACLMNENIGYEEMILRIVNLALERTQPEIEQVLQTLEPVLHVA